MRVKAPPAVGTDWLTTNEIDWDQLTGRVVVLAFWSMSCQASWTHLQRLATLRGILGPRLVVLAIHSPRLDYEKDATIVADAVARAGIGLPVVHDPNLETFNKYSPGGWPASVVIDHRGNAIGLHPGVADIELLSQACGPLVAQAKDDERPSSLPVPMPTTVSPGPANPIQRLAWPAGLAMLDADHLAVSDSGHNRLLVLELRTYVSGKTVGRAVKAIGGLDNPGPICALGPNQVAVSLPELGNIIVIDTNTSTAGVVADNLGRPRGLAVDSKGNLIIADALRNQLLSVKVGSQPVVLAGSGLLGTEDGRTRRASLAEPASVLVTRSGIVFLDSASSNIRIRTNRGIVRTTTTGDVEEAGLVDGPISEARLQNPSQLLSLDDGSLVVVDTGNNRLRRINGRSLETVGVAGFSQPEAAVVLPDGRLIVADTQNHRLVVVDIDSNRARELVLEGVPTGRRPSSRIKSETLTAAAGSRISVRYPAPGNGPWEITIASEPPEILGHRWTLRRSKANGQISIPLAPNAPSDPNKTVDGYLTVETRGVGDRAESATSKIGIKIIS